jgi:putative oxidoreductase
MFNKTMSKYSDWGIIFIRLAVGIPLLMHGLGKLLNWGPFAAGIPGVTGFLTSLGVPAPVFFAWIVALVETFGGLFLILGLWTRLSALLIGINLTVALFLVHISNGYSVQNGGYEFILTLILGAVALFFTGAGKKLVLEKSISKSYD